MNKGYKAQYVYFCKHCGRLSQIENLLGNKAPVSCPKRDCQRRNTMIPANKKQIEKYLN